MARNRNHRIVRWVVLVVIAAGVVAAIVWTNVQPKEYDVLRARRGEIRASFSEPARTRLDKTWRITVPVAGRVNRIELDPGISVAKDQVLVTYDLAPFTEAVAEAQAAVKELEATLVAKQNTSVEDTAFVQSQRTVEATRESLKAAQSQVEAERARAARADKELQRMETLASTRAISQTVLDDARLAAETSTIALREKQFSYAANNAMLVAVTLLPQLVTDLKTKKGLEAEVVRHQVEQARSRLRLAQHDLQLAVVRSPIKGVVLERYEQGDGYLAAGQELLLVGDLDRLEVIADVLTEDAMKIAPNSRVELGPVPGVGTLDARVERIEPQGFTKLSSLGVEQQRVNVIVAFEKKRREPQDENATSEGQGEEIFGEGSGDRAAAAPEEKWRKLGVGYRLQARFLTGAKADALILPRYAVMQSPDGGYYVLKIEDGKLRKQPITLGLKSDLDLEITSGLTETDVVIAHPDATMEEDTRAKAKENN
ncbi:MAG TPA: HlyD family efflux transporter periplasmic adaptor subunit [Planctomycetota bacterium]|nr:HlyD family efflux transporter periplasmic adaptor subunit [Planctomycetota bacterium]